MELIDVLQQIGQRTAQALAPAELAVGTVTAADPLEISIDPAMDTLRAPVLYLTVAVVEKKLPLLAHAHRVSTGEGTCDTAPALEDTTCIEDGKPLPVKNGYIILNRALEAGDKVLLLQVMHGQKFLVLSRVFEEVT